MQISNSLLFNISHTFKTFCKKGRVCIELIKRVLLTPQKWLGQVVGKQLLNVIHHPYAEECRKEKQRLLEERLISSISIAGNQNTQLDAIQIGSTATHAKWIVVFNGMGDCLTNHIHSLKQLSDDTGCGIISFDYRGVGASTGRAQRGEDLIADGQTVVQYLTQQLHIPTDDILLYGHSLGGGVAAEVHRSLAHSGPILSESSFGIFSEAIRFKKGWFFSVLARLTQWNFTAVPTFMNCIKGGVVVNKRDPTIPHAQSLHKKLPESRKQNISIVKLGKKQASADLVGQSTYQQVCKTLKQQGLISHIPHPHLRVMDRIARLQLEKIKHDEQELLQNLKQHLAQEDRLAYQEIIKVIKKLLSFDH